MRDLAQMVGANPNTVQRALSELERDGLAVSERTAGRFVTQDQEKILPTRQKAFLEHTEQFAATMKKAGAPLPQALDLVEKQWNKGESHD